MTVSFATPAWAEQLATRLQDSAAVRAESMSWVHGPIVLVADADQELGFQETALRIDLHEGEVRGVTVIPTSQVQRSPFAFGGSLARWKTVFTGSVSLIDGALESKLRVRGDLTTLARNKALLSAITIAGEEIETGWYEPEPAAASAG